MVSCISQTLANAGYAVDSSEIKCGMSVAPQVDRTFQYSVPNSLILVAIIGELEWQT